MIPELWPGGRVCYCPVGSVPSMEPHELLVEETVLAVQPFLYYLLRKVRFFWLSVSRDSSLNGSQEGSCHSSGSTTLNHLTHFSPCLCRRVGSYWSNTFRIPWDPFSNLNTLLYGNLTNPSPHRWHICFLFPHPHHCSHLWPSYGQPTYYVVRSSLRYHPTEPPLGTSTST